MSRMFEDLKDTLKQELRALSKREMTKESLDTMYKLAESLKAVQTIEAMEKSENGSSSEPGYSMNRGMTQGSYGGSYNGGSYDSYNQGGANRGSYEGGGSNRGSYDSYDGSSNARRGRDGDGDGRYSERPYSRHSSKERMIQKLETMMEEASTAKEREAIMRCMEQLEG